MNDNAVNPSRTSTLKVDAAAEPAASRRDTPLLPPSVPPAAEQRATLTVLTGVHAGRIVGVDGATVTIGRAPDAELPIDEVGVSRLHARVGRTPEGGFYLEDLASTNGTFLGAERVGVALLHSGDLLQLGPHVRVRFAVVDAIEESLYRRLYESSLHDPLTHVFNRRYLTDRLAEAMADARRSHGDLAVLMIDVDSLKAVNDHFGHLAGDRALCTIASRIQRSLRTEDVLARYGGDEFVVLTVGTDRSDTRRLAERVRRAVEGLNMSARGREVHVTASIGVASLAEVSGTGGAGGGLLALADARMYAAKVSGRNRVCAATEPA